GDVVAAPDVQLAGRKQTPVTPGPPRPPRLAAAQGHDALRFRHQPDQRPGTFLGGIQDDREGPAHPRTSAASAPAIWTMARRTLGCAHQSMPPGWDQSPFFRGRARCPQAYRLSL